MTCYWGKEATEKFSLSTRINAVNTITYCTNSRSPKHFQRQEQRPSEGKNIALHSICAITLAPPYKAPPPSHTHTRANIPEANVLKITSFPSGRHNY